MGPLPLAFVGASSISHALWNCMAKESASKEAYIWLMNLTSQFTVLPFFILLMPDWGFPFEALPLLLLSSVAEIVYFLALAKAYEVDDLSVVYPLARSSPSSSPCSRCSFWAKNSRSREQSASL